MEKSIKSIKIALAVLCLLTGAACSDEPLTVTGKVVDESGNALSEVSVRACYSGWGWGEGEGYLVWDKDYCSKTTRTDADGLYVISFEGPASSRLRARKDGWVQAGSFDATQSRIVMARSEDYSARLREEANERALEHCRRQPLEPDTGYYCRVVLPEVRPVDLKYQGEVLAVTPLALEGERQTEAMFAVRGSFGAVDAFSREIVLKIDGEAQDLSFSIKNAKSGCDQDLHFLEFRMSDLDAWAGVQMDLIAPGAKAMFEVNMHTCSAE
jgi:hypothetical protein